LKLANIVIVINIYNVVVFYYGIEKIYSDVIPLIWL
jgi:hypothetical protein